MNPGIFIMGGGGGGGGSGGKRGGAGKGQQGANSGSGGDEASGGGKNALSSGSCGGSGGCPGNHPGNEGSVAKGDPVDVASGRAFTEPALDLRLPGPLPLNLTRAYSSAARSRDTGLGHGWSHSLGWTIDVHRTRIEVWTGSGGVVVFPVLPIGAQTLGPKGWVLRREPWGFAIDAGDDLWRIFSVTEADGKRYRLSAIDDRNRNRIALSYEAGRLVEIADSAGRRVRVTSTPEGRIESLQAKNAWAQGRWVVFAHYKYDAAGDLVSVRDADGHTTTYTYEDHLLTSRRSPTGLTFFYRYDSHGRCVETWGEYPGRRDPSLDNAVPPLLADRTTQARGVFHVKLDFLDDGYVEVADSRTVHRYFVNEQGMLEKSVSGGGVHSRTYDGSGHVTSYTDPRGAVTRWKRDERGREVAITDPLGRQTFLDRNAAGWVCEITDPAGYTTRFDRDAKGNVVMVANPAGGVSTFEYDERGLIVAEIAPNGARTSYSYDEHGNCTGVLLPNGATYRFAYDPLGRLISCTNPLGGAAYYVWSDGARLLSLRDHDGGTVRYDYDGDGNLVRAVATNGGVYRLTWGGYHMLSRIEYPDGAALDFRFDREGHLVSVMNASGEEHRLEYDAAGRLLVERTFSGRTLRYKRDLTGNLTHFENGCGEVTELAYNLADEVIEIGYADGTSEKLFYDERGDLVEVSSGNVSVLYDRDPLRRVVREVLRIGAETHVVDVTYDGLGNRVGRRTSAGDAQSFERDAMGHIRRIVLDGQQEMLQTVNALGQESQRLLPGGGCIVSAFDAVGRLCARHVLAAGAPVKPRPGEPEWIGPPRVLLTTGRSYQYAVGGELWGSSDQAHRSTEYGYDLTGRLVAAVRSGIGAETYAYDAIGNILETGIGAAERRYGQGNLLTQRGDKHYRYDADGRLVEARRSDGSHEVEVWRYAWNAKGLLRSVRRPDGVVVEFSYDPLGRRIEKRVSRPAVCGGLEAIESTQFTWDGDVLLRTLRTDLRDGRSWKRTFVFEDDRFVPMGHRDGDPGSGDWSWYVNDPSGAPLALVRGDGRAACTIERSAWGRDCGPPQSHLTPLSFQGQYIDEETGLSYNRFRYYDPETGQYISPDALGLAGGFNEYAYVKNPVRLVDPLGLVPSAADMARQKADELNAQPGKKPNCVTAVVDKSTGKVYYGTPGDPGLDMGTAPSPLKENAAKLPPEGIAPHKQSPGNCGEPKAVDAALKNGAKLENLEMHTVFIGGKRHGQAKTRCPNCQVTTAGVATTSD
ncbi:RHS repeat-associated core domain-containing protein [Sorangium sp. So ce854]|uniref:RHS repeat-associated core domain-containing protein n=1 Tax=Sorangium sp. So ce854 TaxID=3133322 RepID=UPI003F601A4B